MLIKGGGAGKFGLNGARSSINMQKTGEKGGRLRGKRDSRNVKGAGAGTKKEGQKKIKTRQGQEEHEGNSEKFTRGQYGKRGENDCGKDPMGRLRGQKTLERERGGI